MNQFVQLQKIATKSLRACYIGDKVLASPTHFSDFWARDTFWALSGMIAAGDTKQAKTCLEYFLSFQRADGKIPRKMSCDINVLKYLFGIVIARKTPRPTYYGLVRPFYAMDSELLFIIAVEEYIRATHDYTFAERYYIQIQNALRWHNKRARNNLVYEYFLGNWMDTVMKFGPALYTNVLYVKASESMVRIAQFAGRDTDAEHYMHDAEKVRTTVRDVFWSEDQKIFVDESRLTLRPTFDLAGNTLMVLWGIASKEHSHDVLQAIHKCYEECGAFVSAVPSGQKWWKINPVVRLLGIADYHTSTSWLWIDVLVAEIFAQNNFEVEARKILYKVEEIVTRDDEVGETYDRNGKPYKKLLWKSASPFAWSSGVILATLTRLGYIKSKTKYQESERVC